MGAKTTIVWFRDDLRTEDHPALMHACERGGAVLPVYIWDPDEDGSWVMGSASRWWLHHSLESLSDQLRSRGSRLILRSGPARKVLREICQESGANRVHWSRRYGPNQIVRMKELREALSEGGIEAESFNAGLLHEPWTVQNQAGGPFKVFTPFWRACQRIGHPQIPVPAPETIPAPARWPASSPLEEFELEPTIDWAGGIREAWRPGADGAAEGLAAFLQDSVHAYQDERDRPGRVGTSRLSPHLRFGEIGPRQVWHAVEDQLHRTSRQALVKGVEGYLRQLYWREFAIHLLFHFPNTADRPLRPEFSHFPWRRSRNDLVAWQRGLTGYPIVDAGMRELWHIGWMHNRVRMIAASFLVKDLLLPWVEGARWFWDTLVDADLANNSLGWQWTAGCGADAAPYFRIFNPTLQGMKFDPDGDYVRRWVPELERVPSKWIHRPWEAPAALLAEAGVRLGREYPKPVVDHRDARERALAALERIKKANR